MLVKYFLLSIFIFGAPGAIQCHNICNFTVLVSQKLHNNGFHRNLTYDVLLENPSVDKKEKLYLYDGCELVLVQVFPSGVFVNPDELSDLRRSEKVNAYPSTRVNIEAPMEYAQPTNVTAYIFTNVSQNIVNTWLPVHARYHKAVKGGGYAKNELSGPRVFLHCSDHRLHQCDLPLKQKTLFCAKEPDKCPWKEVVPKMANQVIIWPVPVGNLDYYDITSLITLGVVIAGSIALMIAIHKHKVAYRKRNCD